MTATPEQLDALARALCALERFTWETTTEEIRECFEKDAREHALAVDMLRPLPAPTCGNRCHTFSDIMTCRLPPGHEGDHEGGSVRWAPDEGEVPPEPAPEAPPTVLDSLADMLGKPRLAPEAPAAEAGGCEDCDRARPRGAGGTMSENQIKHVHHCPTCHAWAECAEPCRVDPAGGDAWVPMGADRLCQVCLLASAPMSAESGACPGYQGDYAALSPCPRDWTCPTCFGGLGKKAHDELVRASEMMGSLEAERDEARQEVERLRAALWEAEEARLALLDAPAARAELAQAEQRWQDTQHERDRLRVELKAQGEELARLRAPVWTEETQEAVGKAAYETYAEIWSLSEAWDEIGLRKQRSWIRAGHDAIGAYLAALARGAAGDGER